MQATPLPPPPDSPPRRRSRPVLVIALIVGIVAVLAATAVAKRDRTGPPLDISGLTGQILFSTARNESHLVTCQYPDCDYDVYVMGADGSGVRPVANGPDAEFVGALSPDGSRAIVIRARNDDWQLVERTIDGGPSRVLVSSHQKIVGPAWSADGRTVAFSKSLPTDGAALYLLDLRSRHVQQLTQTDQTGPVSVDAYAAWSPDDSSIAFSRATDATPDQTQIDVVDVSSGAVRTVTTVEQVVGVDWSPDGTSIAFGGQIDHDRQICVVPAAGGDPRGLTPGRSTEALPAWSPDGAYLAFTSDRSGTNDIYVMRSDGSGVVELPTGGLPNGGSSWSVTP